MRVGRHKLIFMGLVALDEVCEGSRRGVHQPTFALRAVLAMLYALSNGNRQPFDAFWQASRPGVGRGSNAHQDARARSNDLGTAYNGICIALGIEQTINLNEDIYSARHEPLPQRRHHSAMTRRLQTDEDAARQRFADAIREQGRQDQEGQESRHSAQN